MKDGFNDDLRATAADLQEQLRVQRDAVRRAPPGRPSPETTLRAAAAGGAAIRVVDRGGAVLNQTAATPPTSARRWRAACATWASTGWWPGRCSRARWTAAAASARARTRSTAPWPSSSTPSRGSNLQGTLGRLHLFLALGVLGGTGLAFLAGFAVARRAMRPIAGLTQAAREVARTRDPAISLPKPQAKDEVAKLADTLEDMLRELDAARGETEAALERQREFVADASHELRTPLTSILANLELLEDELTPDRRPGRPGRRRRDRRLGAALVAPDAAAGGRPAAARPRGRRAAGPAAARRTSPVVVRDAAREARAAGVGATT